MEPPPPAPRRARVGQPIRVAELDDEKLNTGDREPWARATIMVSSVKVTRTDPFIKFRPPNHGRYLRITVRTHVTKGPFTLSNAHFDLVSPSGTTFSQDENVTYRPDYFRDLHGAYGKARSTRGHKPGAGVILYDVPAGGVPHGTRVNVTLFKGQTFGWTLP